MNWFLSLAIFNNKENNKQRKFIFAFFFPFFTLLALWIDSVYFRQNHFDGRILTNFLAILYFVLFFLSTSSHLRKLMVCMVFLSYIGELIFCKALGMYLYRTSDIPLYVPFGHAIVYATGFVLAETKLIVNNEITSKKIFSVAFALLFLSVGIVLKDVFYTIALCVIFIELVGTYFKCWTWVPKTFNLIPAANPPMGAVFFYAGGDVILAKIVSYWKSNTTD